MTLQNLASFYQEKTIFLTGHTGFKGAWLALLLRQLGANVVGYALPPTTTPNLFEMAKLNEKLTHIEGDIRDYRALKQALKQANPDFVFHLAAQAIVLDGYKSPKETFDVNAGGTVNLLEALRDSPQTKGCLIITTDKVYENKHWVWGYRENDALGGKDPYSASKSMAELATEAYRNSFFSGPQKSLLLIATARAGNIIGGGDFSDFRILPDCVRALNANVPIKVRNPQSARPWLYVLDALIGYLQLGAALLDGDSSKADSWNFGPHENRAITVQEIVERAITVWGTGAWLDNSQGPKQAEMPLLRLNWDKAANILHWAPKYSWKEALHTTIDWYRSAYTENDIHALCLKKIHEYMEKKPYEIYSDTT
ncbi:MAG: CDP-glucose 4,6-dehydratase [Parachlamydiaceae bacterium]